MIQGAKELETQYPMGAAPVQRDFYMDDVLTGAEDEDQARRLSHEMDSLLRSYDFILDKWRSNRANVLPSTVQGAQLDDALELSEFTDTTVLGLRWFPKKDELMFKFHPPQKLEAHEATKRRLLSHIMQIFDPNGYIGPVIITARILMQKLWRIKMKWDATVPDEIFREWQRFQKHLAAITHIRIPRWLGTNTQQNVSLHGFVDASELVYGAVLYARVETETQVECILIASKSRVAPLKTLTVPRLELCAAQMLSELVETFRRATERRQGKATLWMDSAIVLAWLTKDAATLKTFVNNRIQKIHRLTSGNNWLHVPSSDNSLANTSSRIFGESTRSINATDERAN